MFPLRAVARQARRLALTAATLGASLVVLTGSAAATEKITVGTPQADSFSFVPIAIGKELGLFAKHNIDPEVKTFADTEALEDALAKGTVQMALGSGTEFAFIPKGAPDTAVAALAVRPSVLVVSARPDAGIKSDADLKDQTIGVTANDPVPAWLIGALSKDKGWGAQGIKALPLTDPLVTDGKINAKVEGIVANLPVAIQLENTGNGRTIVNFGDVVKSFPFYVAFARNDLIQNDQDDVKDFLNGWFESVKWMHDHRDDAIKKAAGYIGASEADTAKLYDTLMPAYSADGKFDQDALKKLAKALVEMKVLDREQDLGRYVKQDILGSGCDNR